MPVQLVERARIVLLVAGGLENKQIVDDAWEDGALAPALPGRRRSGSRKGCPAVEPHAYHQRAEGEQSGGNNAATTRLRIPRVG